MTRRWLLAVLAAGFACGNPGGASGPAGSDEQDEDPWATARQAMVREQMESRGILDESVLEAMRSVPRREFVPEEARALAYADRPIPIGQRQTISQPYIVARMTELLQVQPGMRALEIGTGSGYQAAILAEIGVEVFTIELLPELAESARRLLEELGYDNVHARVGDGYQGWPENAPFERIIVTAAPPELPDALVEQLAPGGRLVAPVGPVPSSQRLVVVEKDADGGVTTTDFGGVAFVPMKRPR